MAKKKTAAPPPPKETQAPTSPPAGDPSTPTPGPGGRPPLEINVEMLEALAERSLTQADCAAVLGCSVDTIQRRYLEVYDRGLQKCRASLRRKQFEMAQAGNVTMLIWLGKNLLGQSDKTEVTGKDGAPLIPDVDREEIIGKLLGVGPTPPAARVQ